MLKNLKKNAIILFGKLVNADANTLQGEFWHNVGMFFQRFHNINRMVVLKKGSAKWQRKRKKKSAHRH